MQPTSDRRLKPKLSAKVGFRLSPLISAGVLSPNSNLPRTKSDPGISTPPLGYHSHLNHSNSPIFINLDHKQNDHPHHHHHHHCENEKQPLNRKQRTMTVPTNLSDYHHPSIVLELLLNLPMECHMGIGHNLKGMIDKAIDEQTKLEHQQSLFEKEQRRAKIGLNKKRDEIIMIAPAPMAIPPTFEVASLGGGGISGSSVLNDIVPDFDNEDLFKPSGDGTGSITLKRKPSIKEFQSVLQEKYTSTLMVAILQSLIGAFLSGYNTSILNVPSTIIISECNLTLTTYSALQSVFCFGGLVGAISISKIADKYGRRFAIILFNIIYIISGILNMCYGFKFFGEFTSSTFIIFAVARGLCGVSAGIASGIIPTYLGEISPPLIRGTIGTLYQLTVCFGLISSEILGFDGIFGTISGWPLLFSLNILLPIIQILFLKYLPESPTWLMNKNEETEARKIFCYLRQCSNVDMDIYFIKTINEYQETLKRKRTLSIHTLSSITADITYGSIQKQIDPGAYDVVSKEKKEDHETSKILFWSVCIAICLQIMQQFSGINSVFYYSNTTLMNAGFTTPLELWFGNILIALFNFLSVLVPVRLMDKLGRKVLLYFSLCGMVISSIGFSASLIINKNVLNGAPDPFIGWLSLIFLILYVISFEIGLGPIPWLMMAEIAPSSHRARIVSIATFINWTSNLIIAQFAATIVLYSQFFPFAAVCGISIIFVYQVIPETKGKTEAQIQKELLKR